MKKECCGEWRFFSCDCHTEGFVLFQDDEDPYNVFLSIWHHAPGPTYSFWWRLKYIWQILRKGRPYGDQIILHKEDLKKLSATFSEYAFKADNSGRSPNSIHDVLESTSAGGSDECNQPKRNPTLP